MAILTEQKTNQRTKPSWFMPHVDPWACPFFCVGHLLYVKYCIYKANFAEPNWTNEDQSWKNHYLFPGLKVGEGGRGKGEERIAIFEDEHAIQLHRQDSAGGMLVLALLKKKKFFEAATLDGQTIGREKPWYYGSGKCRVY